MTGSKTRKYTTASTATVTESFVRIYRSIGKNPFSLSPSARRMKLRREDEPLGVEHRMSLFEDRLWYTHRHMEQWWRGPGPAIKKSHPSFGWGHSSIKEPTFAPPRIRPSRNITARSYSWTTWRKSVDAEIRVSLLSREKTLTLRQTVNENGNVTQINA